MATLTDTQIRNAKPAEKPLRLYDDRGLYLEVSSKGGKWWRLNVCLEWRTGRRVRVGNDVARFMGVGAGAAIPLTALGMVGFLAVTTQGPITAFIIVMEMVSGHTMVLSLMACALLSSGVARLLTRPVYADLAAVTADGAPR